MDEITESLFEELSNPHLPLALTHHRVKQRRKQCSRTTDLLLNKYDILSTLSYTEDVFPIPIIPECHASVLPKESVAFSKCISSHNHDRLVHFYEPDTNFIRILHNPKKYGPILKRYPVVVGPDFSQKVGYAPFVNFENSWWNKALTAYFVSFGVQMIPNVSWSTPMSYFYAFSGIPKHSTIAINSNGILSNSAAVYLWRKGYEEALRVLEPTLVVRYGDKIPGENANISVYYENMNLNIFVMGANGSHATGPTNSEAGRNWKTIGVVGDVQIIQKKNPKDSNKLPEESHTPNRIYAIFEKDGSDVKAIAKYGPDGKKIWEIHTTDHNSIGEHYHLWKDGKPEQEAGPNGKPRNKAYPMTPEMKKLLEKIRNYGD